MKPAPFRYHAPKTVDEAVALLAEVAPADGRVLAGGQSLVPIMAFRLAKPAHLVDINDVAGLDKIAGDGKVLSIGACVRHAAFHKWVVDNPLGKLLSFVARHIAHYPIRMRGTFCGSLAHADPASEWCLTAATLDATRSDILAYRASTYRLLNRLPEARADADAALTLDPKNAEALLERGNIRRLTDDPAGARADWLEVVELAAGTPAGDAAKANLEKLDVKP